MVTVAAGDMAEVVTTTATTTEASRGLPSVRDPAYGSWEPAQKRPTAPGGLTARLRATGGEDLRILGDDGGRPDWTGGQTLAEPF
jgi:hypothetical protein